MPDWSDFIEIKLSKQFTKGNIFFNPYITKHKLTPIKGFFPFIFFFSNGTRTSTNRESIAQISNSSTDFHRIWTSNQYKKTCYSFHNNRKRLMSWHLAVGITRFTTNNIVFISHSFSDWRCRFFYRMSTLFWFLTRYSLHCMPAMKPKREKGNL